MNTLEKPSITRRMLAMFQGLDQPLLGVVFFLSIAGLVTMYSAGHDDGGDQFVQHARNLLLAAGILFVLAQIPIQKLMRLAAPLYAIGVSLLVAVAVFGITKKGAQRWVNLGLVIQPSEMFKITMPLVLAAWFQKREGQLKPLDFAVALVLLGIPLALILKQPDLGTAILVLTSGFYVIFFAGLSWRWLIPPAVIGVIAVALVVIFQSRLCDEDAHWPLLRDYQQERICTLLDPERDPLGTGFHSIQGMIAIGSGGVLGRGFMKGTQAHLEFIPEHTTDFVFAVFAEEFGLLGIAVMIAAFIFLIWRGLFIAWRAPTLFARLLGASISLGFFTYVFVNMGMVSGLLPVVGVPLPFVSYGGTAMVTLGVGLGILMSISKSYHRS